MKSAIFSAMLLSTAAHALPTSSVQTQALATRGEAGDGIVGLVMLIEELIKNEHNAYDPNVQNSFVVSMSTYAGSNCAVNVQTAASYQLGYSNPQAKLDTLTPSGKTGTWNVCYAGGRQYFTDPNIGDFSITFSEAGGVNGNKVDGLHTPILQVKNIGNWEPIDVEGMTQSDGNKLCQHNGNGDGKSLSWSCGIPGIGKSFFGITNQPPITATTYTKGWCGIHFVQHQIPASGGQYGISVLIKDAAGQPIGMLGDPYTTSEDPTAAQVYNTRTGVTSVLPFVLEAGVGRLDSDPVTFAYGNQAWDTGSNNGAHACKVGPYDGGAREGDCGFTC